MPEATRREVEVLEKIADLDAPTVSEVSETCDVKKGTIRKYVRRLKRKNALKAEVAYTSKSGRPPEQLHVTEIGKRLLEN